MIRVNGAQSKRNSVSAIFEWSNWLNQMKSNELKDSTLIWGQC